MKKDYPLGLQIAGMPVRIKVESLNSRSYIKSTIKRYLRSVNEPYFSLHIKTMSQKGQFFKEEDDIKINRQNGRFIFVNKINPNQKFGFIDKTRGICELKANPQITKRLFHPFLVSSCALFLSEVGGFIVHAAGLIYKGHAYVFIGPSGSGKTTIASILKKEGLGVISDEKIVIRKIRFSFMAFSFPWYTYRNQHAPLKNIFFLKKSKRVAFRRLSPSDAITRIFPQITLSFPDREISQKMLNILCVLFKKVPSYEMEFLKDDSFWEKSKELH